MPINGAKDLKRPMRFTCIITIENALTFWTLNVQTKSLMDEGFPTDLILYQLRTYQYLKTHIKSPWSKCVISNLYRVAGEINTRLDVLRLSVSISHTELNK